MGSKPSSSTAETNSDPATTFEFAAPGKQTYTRLNIANPPDDGMLQTNRLFVVQSQENDTKELSEGLPYPEPKDAVEKGDSGKLVTSNLSVNPDDLDYNQPQGGNGYHSRRQCKWPSRRFIIGFALTILTCIAVLLAFAISLGVYETKQVQSSDGTFEKKVYKDDLILLTKVDPFYTSKWSVAVVMDGDDFDYSIHLYSVECSKLTAESRIEHIERRNRSYTGPRNITVGEFLYVLSGSCLNYTLFIETVGINLSTEPATFLVYNDHDFISATPKDRIKIHNNKTLTLEITETNYLRTVLKIDFPAQQHFLLSDEWNVLQKYWNENNYEPLNCKLQYPNTEMCEENLPYHSQEGDELCILAFAKAGGLDSFTLSIKTTATNKNAIVIGLSIVLSIVLLFFGIIVLSFVILSIIM